MKNTLAPGIATAPLRAPTAQLATRHHTKVVRFVRNLSDTDVLELMARLDKTIRASGLDPGALRRTLLRFVSGVS